MFVDVAPLQSGLDRYVAMYAAADRTNIAGKLGFADAMRQHKGLGELLSEAEIQDLTNPSAYLGQCGASVDRVVAAQKHWLG